MWSASAATGKKVQSSHNDTEVRKNTCSSLQQTPVEMEHTRHPPWGLCHLQEMGTFGEEGFPGLGMLLQYMKLLFFVCKGEWNFLVEWALRGLSLEGAPSFQLTDAGHFLGAENMLRRLLSMIFTYYERVWWLDVSFTFKLSFGRRQKYRKLSAEGKNFKTNSIKSLFFS